MQSTTDAVSRRRFLGSAAALAAAGGYAPSLFGGQSSPADLVIHHGKIVTVDPQFHIAEAMAISGDRIVAVGNNEDMLKLAGANAKQMDLRGKTVLPGLIESHAHIVPAAISEFDHRVPEMQCIADVLAYFRQRAKVVPEGQWLRLGQAFITRLREQRYPTRKELDEVAPHHPIAYTTGPDAMLNSMALKMCGIDKNFQITDGHAGAVDRDPDTQEPTGMLRNCGRFLKIKSSNLKVPNFDEQRECLRTLLAAYNAVGFTSASDRKTTDEDIALFQALKDRNELTCRTYLTYYVNAQAPWEQVEKGVMHVARHPLRQYDNLLWMRGLKFFLDGGMLTGTAYMLEPWGLSDIYAITDPKYRGLQFVEPEPLVQLVRLALENELQPMAHCQGDGAVAALVDAYAKVNESFPVRPLRPCICHASFNSRKTIDTMARVGVCADMQPAWLYLDGSTLLKHFGEARTAYFHAYATLFKQGVVIAGGSDHMQRLDSITSNNPYNPFLGMWIALSRQPRWSDKPLHPEQRLTREQAIRFYTTNCAYLTFEEKEKGSLEPGKLADFIVLDRDILTCPVDEVKDIQVEQTYLGGRAVYRAS